MRSVALFPKTRLVRIQNHMQARHRDRRLATVRTSGNVTATFQTLQTHVL